MQSHSTSLGFTFGYADPYYLARGKYGPFSDVYSLGLVLLQMLTAQPIDGELIAWGLRRCVLFGRMC